MGNRRGLNLALLKSDSDTKQEGKSFENQLSLRETENIQRCEVAAIGVVGELRGARERSCGAVPPSVGPTYHVPCTTGAA